MTTVADMLYQLGGMPVLPPGYPVPPINGGQYYFVDGSNGADGNPGTSPGRAFATIQRAMDVIGTNAGCTVIVLPKKMAEGDTDPNSYAETVTINGPSTALIGVQRGRTQGGLPQIKAGSGSTAQITVNAPGCLISGMGINGGGATGGGILLNDNGSTYSATGTTIYGCHFKNCVGSTATNAATGGAIMWSANGGAWQTLIQNNRFYKNTADVVLKGTSVSVPQDVVIDSNVFSGPAASVDCNLYLSGGSGMNGVVVSNNVFPCFPAIGSGSNATPIKATGCVGILSGNTFGCTGKTFGAAGNVVIPATVFMANNYQEAAAGNSGEIGRT